MADVDDDDELWDEFHRVVNLTSRELGDWLRTRDAGEEAEPMPITCTSSSVRSVRRLPRIASTSRPVGVPAWRDDLELTAGQAAWRYRLMSLGHDPLKPAD